MEQFPQAPQRPERSGTSKKLLDILDGFLNPKTRQQTVEDLSRIRSTTETTEIQQNPFQVGDSVYIETDNGDIEDGWKITSIDEDLPGDVTVTVNKITLVDGQLMGDNKKIPLKKLMINNRDMRQAS